MRDLKMRGLWDETLMIWGGEFGRTRPWSCPRPAQTLASSAAAITTTTASACGWPAGGVRGGYTHGATDDFGFAATENPVHVRDLHATILKLLGFDHATFTAIVTQAWTSPDQCHGEREGGAGVVGVAAGFVSCGWSDASS